MLVGTRYALFFFSFPCFSSPSHLLSSPFCSLSLLVVTQIRGHIAGSSSPLPATVRALHFLSREDFSSFFPRRLAPNCAYPRLYLLKVTAFECWRNYRETRSADNVRTKADANIMLFCATWYANKVSVRGAH